MGMNPFFSLCCEMTFLIRDNSYGMNVMLANQAFFESMGGGAGRNIIGREDKSISRIHVYPVKTNLFLFSMMEDA